jgi:hypothetical protein
LRGFPEGARIGQAEPAYQARYATQAGQGGEAVISAYPRKEGAMKKSLKQIVSQTGVIIFLCSVMVLSAPNLNPDFAEWLTTLVTMRSGVADETAKLLVLAGPAIIGSLGLVANVLW